MRDTWHAEHYHAMREGGMHGAGELANLVCLNMLGGFKSLVRMFLGSAKSATHSFTTGFGVPG